MSDYPDYFGYSTFPFYGSPLRIEVNTGLIAFNNYADLFDITQKSRIIGALVRVTNANQDVLFSLPLTIDGQDMTADTPSNQLFYSGGRPDMNITFLKSCTGNKYIWTFGIAADIAFGSRFYLRLYNGGAGDISAYGLIYYDLVS